MMNASTTRRQAPLEPALVPAHPVEHRHDESPRGTPTAGKSRLVRHEGRCRAVPSAEASHVTVETHAHQGFRPAPGGRVPPDVPVQAAGGPSRSLCSISTEQKHLAEVCTRHIGLSERPCGCGLERARSIPRRRRSGSTVPSTMALRPSPTSRRDCASCSARSEARLERRDALLDIVRAVNATLEPQKIAELLVIGRRRGFRRRAGRRARGSTRASVTVLADAGSRWRRYSGRSGRRPTWVMQRGEEFVAADLAEDARVSRRRQPHRASPFRWLPRAHASARSSALEPPSSRPPRLSPATLRAVRVLLEPAADRARQRAARSSAPRRCRSPTT